MPPKTKNAKSSVISGATALADGHIHAGVSIDVSAGKSPSTVVIPDCNPLSGVMTIYIDKPIALSFEKLDTFLKSDKGINVPPVLDRLLKNSELSCDAFYYTHVSKKAPDLAGVESAIEGRTTAERTAALNAPPLLMQISVNFDAHQDKAERDIAIAKIYLAAFSQTTDHAQLDGKIAAAEKAAKGTEMEARAAEALQAAKELADAHKNVTVDLSSAEGTSGGLIKDLTGSTGLSQLFDVTEVKVRLLRCDASSLPRLQAYAAELEGRPLAPSPAALPAPDDAAAAKV